MDCTYFAIVTMKEGLFNVEFPDFNHIEASGFSYADAKTNANEILCAEAAAIQARNETLPPITSYDVLINRINTDETLLPITVECPGIP